MTDSDLILELDDKYPMLNQLLISVAMSQYYPDRLNWAIRDFTSDSDAKVWQTAARELQLAHDFLAKEHRALEGFLNYVLDTPEAAADLLADLGRRLAGATASKS